MSVFFIFVDGIGLGSASDSNPFEIHSFPALEYLSGGKMTSERKSQVSDKHIFKGIDANLGVEGLPQSGTGQTSLFTGINAAKEIGKHFGPFPHSGIKPLLKKDSIFHDALSINKKPHFLNAYPEIFFTHAQKRNRWTCTTLMTKSAGLDLNTVKDVKEKKAVTAEIIQRAWREKLGIDVPSIKPKEAAKRALRALEKYDLVLYEYYLTDKAGHSKSMEKAKTVMDILDPFLGYFIKHMREKDLLVLSSDHGNLEDLDVKTHTRNMVPLISYGRGAHSFNEVEDLTGVKNRILNTL